MKIDMFDILRKDIKIGDRIRFFLITGKEPEGEVISVGENFVFIQTDDEKRNRIFDKLIGGWEVLQKPNDSFKSSSKKDRSQKISTLTGHVGVVNKNLYKNTERKIINLIQLSEYEKAIVLIENELKDRGIDKKYRSNLLLKKAQIYSANNNPKLSEESYQELIKYNENIGTQTNNLSHLYTELARLQALDIDKQIDAINSVAKALSLNPNNNFAINLQRQFEGKKIRTGFESKVDESEQHLLIEVDEDPATISRMIDIDIKEHKYSHVEIFRNGGKPNTIIAKTILEEAKKTREGDLSERFPIYLEAAKAFSELNVGSYDLQDYFESVAYYSMLKGNFLFIQFRNSVLKGDEESIKISRLRDSACSYYIESLNLLFNIDPKVLTIILNNYLKLNLISFYIENDIKLDLETLFRQGFTKLFRTTINDANEKVRSIAFKTIIDFGASSFSAWNKIAAKLYNTKSLVLNPKRNTEIFRSINEIENNSIEGATPREFFKQTFIKRRELVKSYVTQFSKILSLDFEPHNILSISDFWAKIVGFEQHLSMTDLEIKRNIDKIIELLKPYLNRPEKERVNILLQANKLIIKSLFFIGENTTFYGRTIFFSVLRKWKNDIEAILEEKINQSYPKLEVIIDPPYLIRTENTIEAPLIIKNTGEATADGLLLNLKCKSTISDVIISLSIEEEREIPSNGKIELSIAIPESIIGNSNAAEVKVDVIAIYQKKKLASQYFEFTIEREPESSLTYDDIPWRDGPIPSIQLFKGRRKLIADLSQHYLSIEKDKPYILYGLTRTGKSSILEYLNKDLKGETFSRRKVEFRVLTFTWDISEAASFKKASDVWNYLLYQQTYEQLEHYAKEYNFELADFRLTENVRAKDFRSILNFMKQNNLYPIFFIDEFSFIKNLIDEGTINSAFLHTLRQHSLNELASFVFAGTYDIKQLIRDEKYGITGQLVNAIEEQINEISDEASEELVEVIKETLSFTRDAINHIKFLSGRVPYFIQILCKYCGYYASENKRRVIGFPEVEKVVRILIGETSSSNKSLVKKLPENIFQNNQFSPTDPKEIDVLMSSLAIFNKEVVTNPRGVRFDELHHFWEKKGITTFRSKLAEAINSLKEKKIIIQKEDEGIPVYLFSVDLFRRWWLNHHPDLNLILSTLSESE